MGAAWSVSKGDSKSSVRAFMAEQGLDIADTDTIITGFKFDGVIWLNETWDVAEVIFDKHDKAKEVRLVKGIPMSEQKWEDALWALERMYGEVSLDSTLNIWNFKGDDNTTIFATREPRTMLFVQWH